MVNNYYDDATQPGWEVDGNGWNAMSSDILASTSKLDSVEDDTNPKLGGELDAQDNTIGFTEGSATGTGGTTNIDWKKGNKFKFTFGADDETLTFDNPSKPCNLILVIKQDSIGGREITFPAEIIWAGGTEPTLSTAGESEDIIAMYFDGTNYYAQASLNFN